MGRRSDFYSRKIKALPIELDEISENKILQELIPCPRQPGKLRISKKACGSRYLLATIKEYRKPHGDFAMALRWGLELCRNCPVGRVNAGVVSENRSGHTG